MSESTQPPEPLSGPLRIRPGVTIWTGHAMVDRILERAGLTQQHLRRAMKRTVQALDATKRDGDTREADHSTRLRAAEQLFGYIGIGKMKLAPSDVEDPARAVAAVHISLELPSGDAQPKGESGAPAPSPRYLKIHRRSTNGNGHNGNGLHDVNPSPVD